MKRKINKATLVLLVGFSNFIVMLVVLGYSNIIIDETDQITNIVVQTSSHLDIIQQEKNVVDEFEDTPNQVIDNVDCEIEATNTVQTDDTNSTESSCEAMYISTTENEIIEECTTEYFENTEMIQTTQVIETVTTTEHIHTYAISSSCAYYPEEGHYERVCVSEGYTEELYECYDKYCYYCGAIMDDWDFESLLNHSSIHGAYGTQQVIVGTIWHEPIYEEIWVVDKEEYYEEEVVMECIECGYIE